MGLGSTGSSLPSTALTTTLNGAFDRLPAPITSFTARPCITAWCLGLKTKSEATAEAPRAAGNGASFDTVRRGRGRSTVHSRTATTVTATRGLGTVTDEAGAPDGVPTSLAVSTGKLADRIASTAETFLSLFPCTSRTASTGDTGGCADRIFQNLLIVVAVGSGGGVASIVKASGSRHVTRPGRTPQPGVCGVLPTSDSGVTVATTIGRQAVATTGPFTRTWVSLTMDTRSKRSSSFATGHRYKARSIMRLTTVSRTVLIMVISSHSFSSESSIAGEATSYAAFASRGSLLMVPRTTRQASN